MHQAILVNDPGLRLAHSDRADEIFTVNGSRPTIATSHVPSSASTDDRRGHDVQLLEREQELQALNAQIDAACRGSGQLVRVEGAAGVGKTRLLAAARGHGRRAGMRVLAARGCELEREFAYGVVRQLFERVLASADKTERDDLLAGAARQVAVLFDQVDASVDGGDISFALLHGLFWRTANLATHPLMLIIDDLHWADRPSLRFLAYLMPRLEGLPLLLVVALRPAEPFV